MWVGFKRLRIVSVEHLLRIYELDPPLFAKKGSTDCVDTHRLHLFPFRRSLLAFLSRNHHFSHQTARVLSTAPVTFAANNTGCKFSDRRVTTGDAFLGASIRTQVTLEQENSLTTATTTIILLEILLLVLLLILGYGRWRQFEELIAPISHA